MGDLEFLQSCTNGESGAWDEFLKRYSRLIYSYIHNVLKNKGHPYTQEQVRDLFQDIFCALIKDGFQKIKTFKAKNGCSFATWLRQVTVNFVLDYLRRQKPVASLDEETEEGLALKDIVPDNSLGPRDTLTRKERFIPLRDCIRQLAKEDKYFLELHFNQRLGLENLRRLMNLSRGALDMRKSRIIERLRDCFRDKGFMLDL